MRYRNYFSYGQAFTPAFTMPDKFAVTAINKTRSPVEVDLFSPSNERGVEVYSDSISMSGLQNNVISQPFYLRGLHIGSKTPEQLDNPIYFTYNNAAGRSTSASITPSSFNNSYQAQSTRTDIPGLDFTLDVNSMMKTVINPGETVRYQFDSIQGFNDLRAMRNFVGKCEERKFRNFMRKIN